MHRRVLLNPKYEAALDNKAAALGDSENRTAAIKYSRVYHSMGFQLKIGLRNQTQSSEIGRENENLDWVMRNLITYATFKDEVFSVEGDLK